MHAKQMQALDLIPELAADFEEAFGRDSGGLLSSYRMEDADTVIVALGSVLGTIKDVIDEPASKGRRSASWGSNLPAIPARRRAEMLGGVERVVVLEKA